MFCSPQLAFLVRSRRAVPAISAGLDAGQTRGLPNWMEHQDMADDRIRVVVTDFIEANLDWEAEQLAKQGRFEFAAYQLKHCAADEVVARTRDADVIVVNMVPMTEAVLARLDRCKLLIRHGIGYDNVDVDACTRQGIQFAYQPDYCKIDVAEHAIALILACGRKVVWRRRRSTGQSRPASGTSPGCFPSTGSKARRWASWAWAASAAACATSWVASASAESAATPI